MKIAGMLLFPGFELLDAFGPLEMFGLSPDRFKIETVGEVAGPVASDQGPKGVIDRSFAEAAPYDVLLIPGGHGTRREAENERLIGWLRRHAEASGTVASICTGAGLLARTGLLDGRQATTNKLSFDWVVSQGPSVQWRRRARWTVDGKFFTSAGISAGMDMTLALIAHLTDIETARGVAREAEYRWNEDPDADEFSDLLDRDRAS